MSKVIVITGASSGIGEATAKVLGVDNQVILAARREDRLKEIADEINKNGGHATYKVTDVTNDASVEDLAKFVIDQFKRIDVWINNAGIMPLSWLKEKRVSEWDQMIDLNIKGVLYGIGAALPYMYAQKDGHIINMDAVWGLHVGIGASVYSATKFAVRAISEGLRQEVATDKVNIRVTSIYPGATESDLANSVKSDIMKPQIDAFRQEYNIPADRIAQSIKFAIDMPVDATLNDIVIRSTRVVD